MKAGFNSLFYLLLILWMEPKKPPTQAPHKRWRHVRFQWLRGLKIRERVGRKHRQKENTREVTRAVILSGVRSGEGGSIWGLWETLNTERKKIRIFSNSGVLFILYVSCTLSTNSLHHLTLLHTSFTVSFSFVIVPCTLIKNSLHHPTLLCTSFRVSCSFVIVSCTRSKNSFLHCNFIVYNLQSVLLMCDCLLNVNLFCRLGEYIIERWISRRFVRFVLLTSCRYGSPIYGCVLSGRERMYYSSKVRIYVSRRFVGSVGSLHGPNIYKDTKP